MLLKLGVLKTTPDDDRKSAAKAREQSQDPTVEEEKKPQIKLNDPLGFAKKLLFKALSATKPYYVPRFSKPSDPVMTAAEKLLLRTCVIRRKKYVPRAQPGKGRRSESQPDRRPGAHR